MRGGACPCNMWDLLDVNVEQCVKSYVRNYSQHRIRPEHARETLQTVPCVSCVYKLVLCVSGSEKNEPARKTHLTMK